MHVFCDVAQLLRAPAWKWTCFTPHLSQCFVAWLARRCMLCGPTRLSMWRSDACLSKRNGITWKSFGEKMRCQIVWLFSSTIWSCVFVKFLIMLRMFEGFACHLRSLDVCFEFIPLHSLKTNTLAMMRNVWLLGSIFWNLFGDFRGWICGRRSWVQQSHRGTTSHISKKQSSVWVNSMPAWKPCILYDNAHNSRM